MNTLIQNVQVLKGDRYETLDVQITGSQIVVIAPSESELSAELAIDGRDRLLLPGFANGHTHSSQIWQRGLIPPLPLELWLADVFDTAIADLEQHYLSALKVAVDTLLSGGTCVVDHAYLVPGYELETIAALAKAYTEAGIRAVIAPMTQDLPLVAGLPSGLSLPHTPYPKSTPDILAMMEAIAQQFHNPEAGIYVAVGPAGFHRCSDALLEGCRDISDRHNLCRHTHLLETRAQKRLAQERYGGSAVVHLQQLGFLDHRTSLAHCVWLSDADIKILAETQATVVHNPVSNLRLGSGIAPILKCLKAGVNVSFGCDGAASNDAQNLLEAIKLGTMLHTVAEPDYRDWIAPHTALEIAALGGMKGINLGDRAGSITVGRAADLVLYDLNCPSMLPQNDPASLLVLGRPVDAVDRVWINGKPIVENGKVLTVDVDGLHQELQARGKGNGRSLGAQRSQFQTIHQVEPHYRKVMLDKDATSEIPDS
ncbi:amidohydrolase [Altericista sp. CCNU0014]|uniref:amidohydrolase n=1 Tax=Altericista sp. CCNU0014 TaxID=3082949 RepID=UPI00384ABACB